MGAWGIGSFENDTAVDWTSGLEGKSDLLYIEAAFDKVLAAGANYIEAPDAVEAIAAAEAVARLQGKFGTRDAYTETVDNWVRSISAKPTLELVSKARLVLARIQEPPSKLLELWSESAQAENWHGSLSELASRFDT